MGTVHAAAYANMAEVSVAGVFSRDQHAPRPSPESARRGLSPTPLH